MRTTVYVGTSLDGYIAGKDGDIAWLSEFESKELFRSYAEFINGIDAIVIGRGTYETVLAYPTWPYDRKVFVLSTTIKELPEKFKKKASLLSMNPKEVLDHLSAKGFSRVYVDGGRVIQSFLREDLIDEMIITKVPLLLGEGITLFGELTRKLRFVHVRTEVYSNGLVQSQYERRRN